MSLDTSWPTKTLAEATSRIGSGLTPTGGAKVYRESGLPFVRSQNVGWGSLKLNDLSYIDEITHNTFPRSEIRSGDVLLNITGASIGRCAVAEDRLDGGNVNQHVCEIRVDPAIFDPRFVSEFIISEIGQRQIDSFQAGGNRQGLNFKQVGSISVPCPPLAMQRRIAAALTDASSLITTLERLISKKQAIKQGMMQQLLTGKTRLAGFTGEWKRKSLRSIVETPVTDGPHTTPEFLSSGIPFLSVNNLADNTIDLTDLRYISRADHEIFSRKCAPRRGDILLGKAASVGKVGIVDTDLEFNIWSPIAMIRVGFGNIPRFVFYQLQSASLISQIILLTNSSSQGNIGMVDIEKLQLDLPTSDEQFAISEWLSDLDRAIDLTRARLTKTRSIKQGVAQELLTGRTRLPVEEGAA